MLDGRTVRLREVDADRDVDAVFGFVGDPAVTRYMMLVPPKDREEEHRALLAMMQRARLADRAQWDLVAEHTASREVLGMGRIGFSHSRADGADIGYVLHRRVWGRGHGTEIARLLVAFGFSELGVHRIWATVHPDNGASQHVLEHAGMAQEGRQHDRLVYSIVEANWRESASE